MSEKTIYVVRTEGDVEGRSIQTLGYVTGDRRDIEHYFADKKYYTLFIEPLEIKHISSDASERRRKLLEEKAELERKLKAIEKQI